MYYEDRTLVPVPYSAMVLHVSRYGDVAGKKLRPIVTYPDGVGIQWANVAWLGVKKAHKVALLVTFTFKPIWIPVEQWDLIDVGFNDGDLTNHHPDNLHFKLPTGLEPFRYPGYAYIPDFTRYAVNRQGKILNVLTGEHCEPNVSNNGYLIYQLNRDRDGRSTNLGRHRALMLAYSDYPANYAVLHVNHIDGIPGSDDLDNLEWTTPSENGLHAASLRKSYNVTGNQPKPILVKFLETGIVKEFHSKMACAQGLNIDRSVLDGYLQQPNQPVFSGNYQLKYKDDPTPWREVDLRTEPLYEKWGRRVVSRDVFTKEETIHPSITSCADAYGLSGNTLLYWLKKTNQPVVPPGVQFKFYNDLKPWREVLYPDRELLNYGRKNTVLVKYVETGEVREYERQKNAADDLGISYPTLSRRLDVPGQPLWEGGVLLKRKSDPTPWREVTAMDIPKIAGTAVEVEVRDSKTEVVTPYPSLKHAAEANGVGITTLHNRLTKSCKKVYSDGKQYRYLTSLESWD